MIVPHWIIVTIVVGAICVCVYARAFVKNEARADILASSAVSVVAVLVALFLLYSHYTIIGDNGVVEEVMGDMVILDMRGVPVAVTSSLPVAVGDKVDVLVTSDGWVIQSFTHTESLE